MKIFHSSWYRILLTILISMQFHSIYAATTTLTGQNLIVTETEIQYGVEYDLSFAGSPFDFNFFAISNGLTTQGFTSQGFTETNSLLSHRGWSSEYVSRLQWDEGWTWTGTNGNSTSSLGLGNFDDVFNNMDGGASILWIGEPSDIVFSGVDILEIRMN